MNRGKARLAGKAALKCAMLALALAIGSEPVLPAPSSRADRELEDRLRAHIKVLASDDFEGREPGTEGEAKTLRYLGKEWFDIGLVSGTNDPGHEWFAPVTLIAREPADHVAQFQVKGRRFAVAKDQVLVLTSGKRSLVREAPLLFVGKASSPELTRNELAGRVAVLLDGIVSENNPEVSARQNQLLAQGASAVLTVLDGERSLEQVAARRERTGYALAEETLGGDLEAFVTRDAMTALLKGTGRTLDDLSKASTQPGFVPVPLDISVTLEATTRETTIRTHNLIGKLPGRRPETGAVLLLAHWDHFGICAEPPAEDLICNGAIDNASGVAALTEVARRLSRGPQMDRDVYFLATTAEELGLIGAHAFAENPPLPPDQIVAAFNIDSVAVAPRGSPFAIVGRGLTGLDAQIAEVAKAERVMLLPGSEANEFVKRQDGWALLQHDIPAVMVTTAYSKIDRMRAFFDGDYHRPSDDLSRPLELGGAADDVRMLTALTRRFADPRRVPSKVK
ncbi:Zn-dependent M28 family amino/carboxypeptidase [Novosphingobium chloroacetimidivorans]|uniref:Zn-dependent M28 family amino/carboxypeptidase n=1 Tax=Novosphingobium chloroacetimidivorans TaxID=1428314 RepID=A0A7W7NY08_9SPHN|nr:M28 family peptidase [Novosphingobium chloroacetimidivorans]MBB4859760.1 Zn-dependent M28 family amino/carboxypeptidase [Novosphingobium chloroacetimidivorans]